LHKWPEKVPKSPLKIVLPSGIEPEFPRRQTSG
jgi:hypothetical protein